MASVHESVRELRRRLKLSQQGLSNELGVSFSAIQNYEKGRVPSLPYALKLAALAERHEYGDLACSITAPYIQVLPRGTRTCMSEVNAPQPAPVETANPASWDLVIADMRERDQSGLQKYGVRLQPGNGRDSLIDAYQEVLDLAVYLRTAIYERDSARKKTADAPTE